MPNIATTFSPGGGATTTAQPVPAPVMPALGTNFGTPGPDWWNALRLLSQRRLQKQPVDGGIGTARPEVQAQERPVEDPVTRELRIAKQAEEAQKIMFESSAPPKHYVFPGMGLYGADKETDYDRMPVSMQPDARLAPSGPPQASKDWQDEHPPTPPERSDGGPDTRADFFGTGTTDVNAQRAILRALKQQQDAESYRG